MVGPLYGTAENAAGSRASEDAFTASRRGSRTHCGDGRSCDRSGGSGRGWRGIRSADSNTDSAAPAGVYRVVCGDRSSAATWLRRACRFRSHRKDSRAVTCAKADAQAMRSRSARSLELCPATLWKCSPDGSRSTAMRFARQRRCGARQHGPSARPCPLGQRAKSPPSEVWLFGFKIARSWDARYFGPVPLSNVRGDARTGSHVVKS